MKLKFSTELIEDGISTIMSAPVTEKIKVDAARIKAKSKKHKKLYCRIVRQALTQINEAFERGDFDDTLNLEKVV